MKKFVLKNDQPGQHEVNYTIPYEEVLNERQHEAVFLDGGASLVIAGAGTGKTRTLIYRVARLVESGVDPNHILLLTFTRRASREMLTRAAGLLDERCRKVRGGTFHFYCSSLLHQYSKEIGYPNNFTILDTGDAMDIIHSIRAELKFNKLKERFPQKNTIYNIISTAINKQQSLHEVVDSQYPQFLTHIDRIEEIADRYERYKRTNGVMDFDDLLLKTRDLLTDNRSVREQVAAKNRYLMVDEYQDTNALQSELVELFSSWHGNVMVVGDDAQSIYSFRGADHRNIMRFPEQFSGTKIIKLEENYRSTKNILHLANRLMEQAKHKFDKRLYTQNDAGELPALVKAPDDRDQSRFLSQMILNLREQGIALSEISVLFRNARDSFDLEIELNNKKIPYVKYGGQKLSEAAHIKDVLAHIRVIVNPNDAIAWNRILQLLEGVGPKTATDLTEWLKKQQNPYEIGASNLITERYLKQIHSLSSLLQDLKKKDYTTSEAVGHVVSYYKPICEKKFDDYPKRIKDLETFVGIAENYPTLQKLLEDLALDPIEATAVDTEASNQDESPLVLSTIHSAKGLEWDQVFIIQCLDGIIPSGYSVNSEEEIDEELRLLYVACTRARNNLYLTYPVVQETNYGEYFTNLSRFLKDIEEDKLEPWLLVEEPEKQRFPETNPNEKLLSDKNEYAGDNGDTGIRG